MPLIKIKEGQFFNPWRAVTIEILANNKAGILLEDGSALELEGPGVEDLENWSNRNSFREPRPRLKQQPQVPVFDGATENDFKPIGIKGF